MTKVLATNCDDSKVAMAMDGTASPHCVWADGKLVKYAHLCGGDWILANGEAVVAMSENELDVSKYCLGFDDYGNPFFAYRDGWEIKVASWMGTSWVYEYAMEIDSRTGTLAWGVAWAGYPIVVMLSGGDTPKIWFSSRLNGNWSDPVGTSIDWQDNSPVILKASKVASWVYVFWNGSNSSLGTTWIGHVAWDLDASTWLYGPKKKVELSIDEGQIVGLDFAIGDELMSESSSSSSSLNSSSSSSRSSSSSINSQSSNSSSSSNLSSQTEIISLLVTILPGSTADVSGRYVAAGTYEGFPYYTRLDGAYSIWCYPYVYESVLYTYWYITPVVSVIDYAVGYYYGGYGSLVPDGTYDADGTQWTGQAYVNDKQSSSSSSESSNTVTMAFNAAISDGTNPDVSGGYYAEGTYNSQPYYRCTNNAVTYLLWTDGAIWYISSVLGDTSNGYYYGDWFAGSPVGNYYGDGTWNGQVFINDNESSSSSSWNSSSSSSVNSSSSSSSISSSSSKESSSSSSSVSSQSSSSSKESSSSSSSSSTSSQLVMTALDITIDEGATPDVSGKYYAAGIEGGVPYYLRKTGGVGIQYALWFDGGWSWYISEHVGNYDTVSYQGPYGGDVPIGDSYCYANYASAHISDDESSSSNSSISSKSSLSSVSSVNSSSSSSQSSLSSQSPGNFSFAANGGGYKITGYTGPGGTNVIIPSSHLGSPVNAIGDSTFDHNANIKGVTIPSSVLDLGANTFNWCSTLQTISIPNTVTSGGSSSFNQCTSLASVSIGSGLSSIASSMFSNCPGITSIVLPNTITGMGTYAFYHCANLTNVTLSTNLTNIGNVAFGACLGLNSITIPASVTNIGDFAFNMCSSLTSVYFQGNAPTLGGGSVFGSVGGGCTIYYHAGATGFTNPWGGLPTATY